MSLTAATLLPPTPRDFDIHESCLVRHISTRQIATKHGISQTRVRQVITRVSTWLAANLPVKTEAEQEQETRLAQHLAADQLRHQIEELQCYWKGTSDPKYLRQQSRAILALARLGVLPGAIETLAADITEGPYDPAAPQQPWSADDPWANQVAPSSPTETESPPLPDLGPSTLDLGPPLPPPPSEYCSPSSAASLANSSASPPTPRVTPYRSNSSGISFPVTQDDIDGLNLFEERLLTLIEQTTPTDTDRLASLNKTLHQVRQSRAKLLLQISPQHPGVSFHRELPSPATSQVSLSLDNNFPLHPVET